MRKRCLIALLGLALLISGAGLSARRVPPPGHPEGLGLNPVLLGGFQALAINLVWVRMVELHRAGSFFEVPALARIITKLQPTSPAAWRFQGHVLCVDIPSELPDETARAPWVIQGLRLFHEGLAQNPESRELAQTLAVYLLHHGTRSPERVHLLVSDPVLNPDGLGLWALAAGYFQRAMAVPGRHLPVLHGLRARCLAEQAVAAEEGPERQALTREAWAEVDRLVAEHPGFVATPEGAGYRADLGRLLSEHYRLPARGP